MWELVHRNEFQINSSSRSMPSATIFIASSTLVAFERAAVILREMER